MKVTESVSERQSWSSAMRIEDVRIYGFEDSMRASGLPYRLPDTGVDEDMGKAMSRADMLADTPIGSGHDNYLCGIVVQMTVTAPLYWWPQLQRYHHVDIVSATSTMHTLHKVTKIACGITDGNVEPLLPYFSDKVHQNTLVEFCSFCREYRDSGMFQDVVKANLPCGYLQTARVTTNYRQLRTIYAQRHSHLLEEWRGFCERLRRLDASYLITGEKE